MMAPRPPVHKNSDHENGRVNLERITLRAAKSGQALDVVVLSKRADRIHIMLSEGTQNVFCELKPTPDALAYAGMAMGREIVYERSRAEVESDIDDSYQGRSDSAPR